MFSQNQGASLGFVREGCEPMLRKILVIACFVATCSALQAGPFGLISRRGATNNNTTANNNGGQQVYNNRPFLGSASAAAHYMASICRMGHFGGNTGYEGVGVGSSPYQAEMNCCYRNKWTPREVGVAQGANGLWYACCRY